MCVCVFVWDRDCDFKLISLLFSSFCRSDSGCGLFFFFLTKITGYQQVFKLAGWLTDLHQSRGSRPGSSQLSVRWSGRSSSIQPPQAAAGFRSRLHRLSSESSRPILLLWVLMVIKIASCIFVFILTVLLWSQEPGKWLSRTSGSALLSAAQRWIGAQSSASVRVHICTEAVCCTGLNLDYRSSKNAHLAVKHRSPYGSFSGFWKVKSALIKCFRHYF